MKNFFLLSILFLLLSACQRNEKPVISFYYWKTIFTLSASEKNTLQENKVKKLYIRYFDIDLHPVTKEPVPKSPIRFLHKATYFTVVPVVYITNSVLLRKNVDVQDLAKKTNNLIQQINEKNHIKISEIQIDCDWSLSSRDNYLRFIECLKKVSQKKLSATIRLHQIKYFEETKIPNVEKGVLMYYNMGKIAPDSLNSIYDRNIALKYLSSLKHYPLPINIALPIYSWGIHIREGKVIGLRNKITFDNLKKDSSFVLTNSNWWRVRKSNYKNGIYYRKNDFLKQEAISGKDLLQMADDLNDNSKEKPEEIIFYDLDEFNIKKYEKNIFEEVSSCF